MTDHGLADLAASGHRGIELGYYPAPVHDQQAVGQRQELVEVL
jgi:hypothetical protein